MKKSLLLAAGFAMAVSAGAQNQVGFLDAEALGLSGKPTLADNTELASTAAVKMTFLNGQGVSQQNPDFKHFKYVAVNGEYIKLVPGIGGTANGTGDLTAPTGGCIYNYEVSEDGWLILASKISSNKNFYVFEGRMGQEPMPVAYTLGMYFDDPTLPDLNKIVYTLPADDMGYVNMSAADINDYTFGANTIAWPVKIATKSNDTPAPAKDYLNGTGVLMFKVYKDAGNYMALATGSKMNTCGFIFVPGNPDTMPVPSVSIYAPEWTDEANSTSGPAEWRVFTGEQPAAPGEESGIADIIVNETIDENAPMFNVLGQQVDASYKGLVIKNGKKFMNR